MHYYLEQIGICIYNIPKSWYGSLISEMENLVQLNVSETKNSLWHHNYFVRNNKFLAEKARESVIFLFLKGIKYQCQTYFVSKVFYFSIGSGKVQKIRTFSNYSMVHFINSSSSSKLLFQMFFFFIWPWRCCIFSRHSYCMLS